MIDWRVAIPTYKRCEQLKEKTLGTLARGGVSPSLVDIFVADATDADRYKNALTKGTYAKIVVAEPGIGPARNFISHYYPDGKYIVEIDDDIQGVVYASSPKQMTEISDLSGFFANGFEACTAVGARIWGVYPMCNPFYMSGNQEMTTDLRPIIGALHGHINDHSHRLVCSGKEDIERTLLYFEKDLRIVRYNRMAAKQVVFAKGGLENLRTAETSLRDAKFLCERWPHWVTMKKSFSRGHAEVKLKAG